MKLEARDTIHAPALEVFSLLRDRLTEIVPHMPNIDRIEIQKREPGNPITHVIAVWHAKAEIPEVAKKFLKPEYLAWRDDARWNETDLSVDYILEPPSNVKLYSVKGRNRLVDGTGRSVLHVSCDVNIYPEKLPGLPSFMARLVKKPVEETIRLMLEPNLKNLAKGLNSYFKK